ncbi:MAG: phytanoyl-CoA dioxygenase family protein [Alphaproteobacteria bacterium]|jgi:hypothetical protein|nr:phytanoyl-CoA dioxygenase family protein [Alphaproteobacteria bacterium]
MQTVSPVDFFNQNGFYIIEKAIPSELIEVYEKKWIEENKSNVSGWAGHTSYLDHPEILDILCHKEIDNFFVQANKGVALHLNLTYAVSTEKDWHVDTTIATLDGSDNYTGAWIALEDISEDAGPFQFIPGSHNWQIDFNKLNDLADSPGAAKYLRDLIKENNGEIVSFLPKKGDVLFWHGRLIHRGSVPRNKKITRKSLIGHYCNMFANEIAGSAPKATDVIDIMENLTEIYAKWEDGAHYFVDPEGLKCPKKKKTT